MMIHFFLSAIAIVVAMCCIVFGCRGKSDRGTVSRTVTLDGVSLAGASVIFCPASGEDYEPTPFMELVNREEI